MTHPLIIKASEATGIPVDQIMSRSRIQRICWVRFAIMAELRQTGLTLDRIGAILDRSPNAVISGLEQAFALRTLPGLFQDQECFGVKGYVYFFVASVDGGYRVKIGHTRRSPLQRLLDIQPGSPVDMEIFGYFHGDVPLEKKFHRTFDSLRIHNEWFVGEHKLLDFVWYLAGYGAARRPCTWDEVECAIHDNILAECAPNPNIDEAAYLASADMSEWRELAKQWA